MTQKLCWKLFPEKYQVTMMMASNNAYSNEVDTVMESSSNNDGTTYNPADAPPAYPDVVDHDDSESLPSYSELGDGYSYV